MKYKDCWRPGPVTPRPGCFQGVLSYLIYNRDKGSESAGRRGPGRTERTGEKMAFALREKNGLSWLESDMLPCRHMFTRRLGGVGDFSHIPPSPTRSGAAGAAGAGAPAMGSPGGGGGVPAQGMCFTRQVHGIRVRYADGSQRCLPPLARRPEDCDGLVTDRPGVPLAIFTADCVPVLLCDPESGVAAARPLRLAPGRCRIWPGQP